jgi:hypothetical protein
MQIDPPLRNPPSRIYARFRHPEQKAMARSTVNGKPYNRFDPAREWVILEGLTAPAEVVAFYD